MTYMGHMTYMGQWRGGWRPKSYVSSSSYANVSSSSGYPPHMTMYPPPHMTMYPPPQVTIGGQDNTATALFSYDKSALVRELVPASPDGTQQGNTPAPGRMMSFFSASLGNRSLCRSLLLLFAGPFCLKRF
jgi:hypothetical protein